MTAGVDDESVDEAVASAPDEVVPDEVATAERPRAPITVEQAYLAKLRAAGAVVDAAPSVVEARPPRPVPPSPVPPSPVPPRPVPVAPRPPVAPGPPPHLRARPRIEPEQGILGLSRHTRSRLGSRLFNLFFVCVFALILIQMIVALLTP